MASEGKPYVGPNLTKALQPHEKVKLLKEGDPWMIFYHEPIPPHVTVGFTLSRWYGTDEPGRLFKVVALHPNCIETVYVGFDNGDTPAG